MSSHLHMLHGVICDTFEDDCGKWQSNKDPKDQRAFKVSFNCAIDYAKEEGYRTLEMVIWGEHNYVQVWTREVTTLAALDSEGEMVGDYVDHTSEWTRLANHDSAWREGVHKVLELPQIRGITSRPADRWYTLIECPKFSK